MSYQAPIQEMLFVLQEIAGLEKVAALPGFEEASPDMAAAILEEAGKLGAETLAPINQHGDKTGNIFKDYSVTTPKGWKEAWQAFKDGGWNTIAFDPEYGGQGLPWLLATAIQEIWHSANMSFGLCPMLTQGTVELLSAHGNKAQKDVYLGKLISGEWTGTMNLTESSAGSDLGVLRTKAVKSGEHYLISGQKIFITYGEHDMAENIIHFTLARTPDAPAGVKGISLFIVPKFLVNPDGSFGARNDVRCVSIEHKLGINASPTAVMSFGDNGGAVGFLVGEEGRGLEYMFTMMNNARLSVGLEGVAIAERAYQQALNYAKERVQSKPLGGKEPGPIINHPDVRRMLLSQKSLTNAARSIAYLAAHHLDMANKLEDADHQARVDLLIPIVKGWCSDVGIEVADLGVQIHGGMGFIEETGAAQHLRDARITAIYEGTNGIQANDLVFRKIGRDKGAAARKLLAEMREFKGSTALATSIEALAQATDFMAEAASGNPLAAASGAYSYMRLWGNVLGGYLLEKAAAVSGDANDPFFKSKKVLAQFFAEQVLCRSSGLLVALKAGSSAVMALKPEEF